MKIIITILILVLVGVGYSTLQKANPPASEQAESGKITQEQAVKTVKKLPEVKDYLDRVPNGRVEVDNELEGKYNIHVYEIKDGHTATFNWYRVSIKSGEVKKEF